jgi:hypothetical protein
VNGGEADDQSTATSERVAPPLVVYRRAALEDVMLGVVMKYAALAESIDRTGDDIGFGGMEVAAGWVDAQRPS